MKSQDNNIRSGSIEGICLKCGTHKIGNALRCPQYQKCPKCGKNLEIYENGKHVDSGFWPFTANLPIIKTPNQILELEVSVKDEVIE